MDIIPETINRIRLSDDELLLLNIILEKMNTDMLNINEKKFHKILLGRTEGRLKIRGQILESNEELF